MLRLIAWIVIAVLLTPWASAEPLGRDQIAAMIQPPYALGEAVNDKGVWTLLNSGGAPAGFVFETQELAPLPGFSGAPINLFVMLDSEGRFIKVSLISQNEPIFVSGLGEAPFLKFLEQYAGLSINQPMTIGSPYGQAGAGSELTYLDGVTKATASVRIAHDSLMAATLQVAREKMQGISAGPPARPDPDHDEPLNWQALLDQGLVGHLHVTNAQADAAFQATLWADDDPEGRADPEGAYLDLWVVDLGPPAMARAVLDDEGLAALTSLRRLSPDEEPILVIDTARHGLVSAEFVRNTAPDRLSAEQDGLPVALKDADMTFGTLAGVPKGAAMVLRIDRRLGFDPTRDWQLKVQAVRMHGMFQPQPGSVDFALTHHTDARFYLRAAAPTAPVSPWRDALRNRAGDLLALGAFVAVMLAALLGAMRWFASHPAFPWLRRGAQAVTLGFVGWWGQGQLSIVTPLAVLRTAIDGGSYAYLLYDPFSLLVWGATILGFFLVGRGLFCGWFCPFGVLQEAAHGLGRRLHLPQWEPSARWDRRLKWLKYVALAALIATVLISPDAVDTAVEVEPFKTAITTFFVRDWYYVAYAALWLGLGLFTYKGFCRYLCPLGALMAIGGLLRLRKWIPRRVECGSPCQLCRVRCPYGAITAKGKIEYSECFQCLDCVTIHDDAQTCVPLVLAAKGRKLAVAAK